MFSVFDSRRTKFGLSLLVAVLLATLLTACPANPDRVKTNTLDTSLPTPVNIKGHMTGAAGDSNAGVYVPNGTPPLVLLNSTAGQLEITVTASDPEGGIANLEIHTNDKVCDLTGTAWGGSGLPTNVRANVVNTPDSSGTLPVKSVALANIQTTMERGTKQKRTWEIFGTATNSAGNSVNIGPLVYTAVAANVPAEYRNGACP